jgi:hypothetical protein
VGLLPRVQAVGAEHPACRQTHGPVSQAAHSRHILPQTAGLGMLDLLGPLPTCCQPVCLHVFVRT